MLFVVLLDEKIVLELFLKKQTACGNHSSGKFGTCHSKLFRWPLKYPNNIEKITRVQILLPGSPSNTSPTTAHPNEEQYGGGSTLIAILCGRPSFAKARVFAFVNYARRFGITVSSTADIDCFKFIRHRYQTHPNSAPLPDRFSLTTRTVLSSPFPLFPPLPQSLNDSRRLFIAAIP